jgi:hypothetical protein
MRRAVWSSMLALALVACDDVGDSSAVPSRGAPGAVEGGDATVAAGSAGAAVDAGGSDATFAEGGAAPDAEAVEAGAEDVDAPDATVPDATISDASPADGGGPDAGALDANRPDTNAPDTGPLDAGGADTAAPEAGGDASIAQPCTTSATGCVACTGNASGLCSSTEAAFVAHDIAAGHAATTDCYSCLVQSGCLDDTQFGDHGHECDDLTGTFDQGPKAGTLASSLCLDALRCVLATSCSSSDISISYCGPNNAGNACQTAASPDGACYGPEIDGLGVTDNATVLKDYTDTNRPAGMANQIFSCAESNGCAACLR